MIQFSGLAKDGTRVVGALHYEGKRPQIIVWANGVGEPHNVKANSLQINIEGKWRYVDDVKQQVK